MSFKCFNRNIIPKKRPHGNPQAHRVYEKHIQNTTTAIDNFVKFEYKALLAN